MPRALTLLVLLALTLLSSLPLAAATTALLVIDPQRCFTAGGALAVPDGDAVMPTLSALMHSPQFDAVLVSQDFHPHNHVSFAANHHDRQPWLPHSSVKHHRANTKSNIVTPHAKEFTEVVLAYNAMHMLCGYEAAYEWGRECPGLNLTAIQSVPFNTSDSHSDSSRQWYDSASSQSYTLVRQTLWPRHCIQHTDQSLFHPLLSLPPTAAVVQKGYRPHIDSYSAVADSGHFERTAITEHLTGVTHIVIAGLALDYCVYYSAMDVRLMLRLNVSVVVDASRAIDSGRANTAVATMSRHGIRTVQSTEFLSSDEPKSEL